MSEEQTYVYDNLEVRKTGRTAKKVLRSNKVDELFEITPVDEKVGTWKKWVRDAELFEVEPEGDEE
jgi:peptidyl-tRNA hydrolase